MLRANHLVNRHEQGVRTMGRAGRATVNSWRQDRPETGGGQKLVALVVRREDSTLLPLKRRCAVGSICPENDSPFYGFIRSGLNYEHHVRIT